MFFPVSYEESILGKEILEMAGHPQQRLTDYQKRRIKCLRQQNVGYATIASELKVPLGSVKAFCRRNGLQSADLTTSTQPEKITESSLNDNLISAGNRANSTTVNRRGSLVNTRLSAGLPVCEVTVSFADESDETALADVLTMLSSANFSRR